MRRLWFRAGMPGEDEMRLETALAEFRATEGV